MTFYWKQCRCNSWWPLPFARRTLPGCSQAKPSRRNLQGWPQHWSGRLSSRWRMLQIWIGNCLVFFFFKFMFFKFLAAPIFYAICSIWELEPSMLQDTCNILELELPFSMLFAAFFSYNFPSRMLRATCYMLELESSIWHAICKLLLVVGYCCLLVVGSCLFC